MENEKNKETHRKKNRDMFNSIAKKYDFLNRFLSLGTDKIWRKMAIRRLKIMNNHFILDLATGTGDLAKEALKKKPHAVVGIDPAYEMIKRTKAKLKHNYYAIEGYAESLPFVNSSFDRAMIAYGIRNFSDREKALKEIFRVLKKGSLFGILEFSESKSTFFRFIYKIYFHKILSKIGGFISKNKEAYTYLPESVSTFVSPEELSKECEGAGFETLQIMPIFTGITSFILVKKP
ncbi:MAG: bifunctional demethylmenaquinone methyltransferase/2-methoxy-6-polyprenyl-1,4-benzoquinol methylase UbiE [Spirochaetia bacterium]|nr:bifunctional demethylmenaquinone methyltransferase/2-methoxy-6-polyprenyl-1,4-benzoquinol methylase UbiE [Spirochaetia bacterium]